MILIIIQVEISVELQFMMLKCRRNLLLSWYMYACVCECMLFMSIAVLNSCLEPGEIGRKKFVAFTFRICDYPLILKARLN